MGWLELRIPPLLVWLVVALAMLGAAYAVPQLSFALPGRVALALVTAAAGAALAIAGVAAFRRQRTTVNPLDPGASTSVVSTGVYRWTRNPLYLGFLLALAGWAVFLSNALAVILLPVFTGYMTRFQIAPEERALLAKFDAEYEQYRSRVRRWV